jgi:AAA domain
MATMKPIQMPHKAEKRRVKLKLGIQGPSGSGKTLSGLALIKNLWPNAKVLCVDTENQSAELYSDHSLAPAFDELPLEPPFSSDRYEACIDYAVKNGYDVLLIDSISHQWEGDGGILRRKDEMDRRPGNQNSYMNWNAFTPEHTHFIESIKQSPIHIVATMRSKQDYALDNSSGKAKPVKLGLAPIVREGTEYEFAIVFDIQMDHKCTLSKNRTGLFENKVIDLADPAVAAELRAWLDSGKAVDEPKDWSTQAVKGSAVAEQREHRTEPVAKPVPISYPPPTIAEYPVEIETGRGKNKKLANVIWYELSGHVIGVKQQVAANGAEQIIVGIHGMPETNKVPGERHRRFECYHKHLQPILATAKPGSLIEFRYFPEKAGEKSAKPGTLVQYIEELVRLDSQFYNQDGEPIPAPAPAMSDAAESAVADTHSAPPETPSASPVGLFPATPKPEADEPKA